MAKSLSINSKFPLFYFSFGHLDSMFKENTQTKKSWNDWRGCVFAKLKVRKTISSIIVAGSYF